MTLALQLSCQYGITDCLEKAQKSLSEYSTTTPPTEPDRDQKLTTYCYGIQEGTETQWDDLWANYHTEINANEQYSLRLGWPKIVQKIVTNCSPTKKTKIIGVQTSFFQFWNFL